MDISFPGLFFRALDGINFQAMVDGRSVDCVVSFDALREHYPASSFELSYQFGQPAIHAAADRKIRAGEPDPVRVESADLS